MKTTIRRTETATIIELEGRIDYETQDPFKEEILEIVKKSKRDSVPKKLLFDFKNLEFVGSSGITTLVQTLKEVNLASPVRPEYAGVRSEFQRLIRAFDEDETFTFVEIEASIAPHRSKRSH